MKAVILSEKAIDRIILALRAMKYNTQVESRYAQAVVKRIQKQAVPAKRRKK